MTEMERLEIQDLQDIDVRMQKHIVRVANDEALIKALQEGKRRAALLLAQKIREDYRQEYGEELKIRARSLACEIYWHNYMREKALAFERRFGRKRPSSWLIRHMDVSDCGERKEDNNRWLWDLLSILF